MGKICMSEPWKNWIPGVLSKEQVIELCKENYIKNVKGWNSDDKDINPIDHSAIDLTLANEGYKMVDGSIKPTEGNSYRKTVIGNDSYATSHLEESNGIFSLEKKQTYLFRLNETLDGLRLKGSSIYGQATAKSSVGRVDVLARLIVDEMDRYEYFDPQKLPSRDVEMFLEITPITFSVRVKVDEPLSQLRLFYCQPDTSRIRGKELCQCLLHREGGVVADSSLTVDLSGTEIFKGDRSIYKDKIVAFRGKNDKETPKIDLWGEDTLAPENVWDYLEEDERTGRLLVEKEKFYILRSKERLCLPEGIAVYCRAIDETIGEMRIHYAGFAHPFFGKKRKDKKKGTPLIFEVRGHNINVNLVDGEKLARLEFYRMSKDCKQKKGKKQAGKKSNGYNEQELKLSRFFKDWGTSS
jgi:dCTP deaminase